MSKAKLIVVAGFVVAFGAGLVVGVSAPRTVAKPPERSWLSEQLDLTPAQAEQIRKIWSNVVGSGRGQEDQRRTALRKEREEAIAALVAADRKADYDKVMQDYAAKTAQLGQERRRLFDAAVEQTKQLLNDQQRAKYEQLLKNREAERFGHRQNRRADEPATSRSVSE